MQDSDEKKLDRRSFLNKAAGVVAGSAFASTALSYDRIIGANDRIALGHIGVGNRGRGLHLKHACELARRWRLRRRRGGGRPAGLARLHHARELARYLRLGWSRRPKTAPCRT